jgi:hypothetical protein
VSLPNTWFPDHQPRTKSSERLLSRSLKGRAGRPTMLRLTGNHLVVAAPPEVQSQLRDEMKGSIEVFPLECSHFD